jgi:serine/threonine-protein kinase
MEYVDGRSLSEVLEIRGALPIDDAVKIMVQVLSAVGYAHKLGVIHRDLKPSNVMVMGSGEAKVTDFGIAKVLGSSKLTRTGTAMGSAHYMSPEQIRRPETVDARSDVYSLGCVFYEVLTGRPPFGEKDASGTESDFEIKTAHVTELVPSLDRAGRSIPDWLASLVMKMLEKEAEKRPPSCEAILAEIEKPSKKAYVSKSSVPKSANGSQFPKAEVTLHTTREIETINQLENDRQQALDWESRQRLEAKKRAEEFARNQEEYKKQKEADRKRQTQIWQAKKDLERIRMRNLIFLGAVCFIVFFAYIF